MALRSSRATVCLKVSRRVADIDKRKDAVRDRANDRGKRGVYIDLFNDTHAGGIKQRGILQIIATVKALLPNRRCVARLKANIYTILLIFLLKYHIYRTRLDAWTKTKPTLFGRIPTSLELDCNEVTLSDQAT